MVNIVRVQAVWTGFQGAPGYTSWYGEAGSDAAASAGALSTRMRAFFNSLAAFIPSGVEVKVQRLYQVLEASNGVLLSEGNVASDPAVVVGTNSGNYAGSSGAAINWETGTFNANGRRIRGRTYLVPLGPSSLDNDGTISPALVTGLTAAGAAALGGTGSLGVWTRPSAGGSDGAFTVASTATVKDKSAVLRSRRD